VQGKEAPGLPCDPPRLPASLSEVAHRTSKGPYLLFPTSSLPPRDAHVHPETDHRRSMGFLNLDGVRWACFLVTRQDSGGIWKGHFAFRTATAPWGSDPDPASTGSGDPDQDEVRTADIFIEGVESEIDRKARGLGRPLLSGLLSSALHTRSKAEREGPPLQSWFRDMLRQGGGSGGDLGGASGSVEHQSAARARTIAELRSIYDSYRLHQVVHLINLVDPGDFEEAVHRILEGRAFDFSSKDRLQFAMIVVDHLERLLPLPPFEVWAQDYLANAEAYEQYTMELFREGGSGEDGA
jgi:hypothetical protein